GYGLQRVLVNRVLVRNVSMTMVMTLGVSFVISTVLAFVWGPDRRSITVGYAASGFDLFGARVPVTRLAIFVLSVALTCGLHAYLTRAEGGRRIQAVSQDPIAAESIGLSVAHYYGLSHALAAAIALAVGGVVPLTQPVHPFISVDLLLIAFAVVVLGGFGSIVAILPAGIVLALGENLEGYLIGLKYQRLAIFAVYLAIATLRPQGLFGRRLYAR
ncbi:MAG TPA: branched-chain amino acid ABC transporter permease, partial [Ilumatobacteraceae bacterium]|nr:branched-chain amino acid ABC transporter permease [Ilumatobacteraceae bacterium]